MEELNNSGTNILLLVAIFAVVGFILTRKKK